MRRSKETMAQRVWRAVTGRTPDVLYRPPAAKIKEIRRANPKATDAQLAARLGVSKRTLKGWESGKAPSKANAKKIDRTMRKDLTERRAARVAREGAKLTMTGKVKIGGEAARTRKFNLDKVLTPDEKRRVAQAAASGKDEVVKAEIQRAIARYIGAPNNDPGSRHVDVLSIDSLKAG